MSSLPNSEGPNPAANDEAESNSTTMASAGAAAATVVPVPAQPSTSDQVRVRITQSQANGDGQRSQVVRVDRSNGRVRLVIPTQRSSTAPRTAGRGLPITLAASPNGSNVTISSRGIPQVTNGQGITGATSRQRSTRAARLDPLLPQPVPDTHPSEPIASSSTESTSSDTNDQHDEDELANYRCTICFEFMKDPVGCPSTNCSSRFCFPCMQRVAQDATMNRNSSNNGFQRPSKPKCPTCRMEFTNIVRDERLKQEMLNRTDLTMPCKYPGCPERSLHLANVQEHESTCPYMRVKCRYAPMGCTWIGPRGELATHETNDCALAKVKGLVEQVRSMKAEHAHRLDVINQQSAGAVRMLQIYRQTAQQDQMKSTTNLFHLLHYSHVLTCSTYYFYIQGKSQWSSFYNSHETRAAITNFLVLWPTFLICFVLALTGFQSLSVLCFGSSSILHHVLKDDQEVQLLLLEDGLMGVLLSLTTILLMVANFVDTKSSVTWGSFRLPKIGKQTVLRDVVAVATFTMYIVILEFHGAPSVKAKLVWMLLAVTSTMFPALIMSLSVGAQRFAFLNTESALVIPPASQILNEARSMQPVLFGLRYSILASFCGIGPTVDAAILNVFLMETIKEKFSENFVMRSCFFDDLLLGKYIWAFFAAKFAVDLVRVGQLEISEEDEENSWAFLLHAGSESLWILLGSLIAFIALLLATFCLNKSLQCGYALGNVILKRSKQESRRVNANLSAGLVQNDNYAMSCFAAWICAQGLLVQFR